MTPIALTIAGSDPSGGAGHSGRPEDLSPAQRQQRTSARDTQTIKVRRWHEADQLDEAPRRHSSRAASLIFEPNTENDQ
jgi:hydroxymethylpyrimidine/phosphomethylpyrimidine kinase